MTGKCGTYAGYKRHRRRDETACPGCQQARREYNRQFAKQRNEERSRMRRELSLSVEIVGSVAPVEDPLCAKYPLLHDSRREGESPVEFKHRLKKARVVCRDCPEVVECRSYAQRMRSSGVPLDGVFAGELFRHGGKR